MIRKIFSYIIIASIITTVFTACSDDDNMPKEKTPEEIAAENLAEFKKLIGTGIGNEEHEFGYTLTEVKDLTVAEYDKINFELRKDMKVENYFLFDGTTYTMQFGGGTTKGTKFDFEKKDGVFTLYAAKETEKEMLFNGKPDDTADAAIKIVYNTNTKKADLILTIYAKQGGAPQGTIILRITPKPYNPEAAAKTAVVKKQSVANRSTTSFTGVHYVYVELQPTHWTANLPARILKPKGYHYVKFTQKSNGKIRAQFCDASGTVGGDNDSDYYYSTTKHFWKNAMPMALNLYDVDFSYSNGTISSGTYVMAHARPNQNPNGTIPAFFLGGLTNQNSGANADIVTTTGNTANSFVLKVKLDFELPFNCIITKQ